MQARPTRRLFAVLLCAASLTSVSALEAQTYRQTWTTTDDFEQGAQINVNATDPRDQLQLNLGQIETPYLWIANTYSDTVTKIDTATGRAESVTTIPTGGGPSRTAVDLDFNCWVAVRLTGTGVAHKLRASDGALIDTTQYVGRNTRGVAINAAGEVWISSSVSDANQGGFGWMKVDSNSFQPLETFVNDIGSYGIAIDPYGRMFSTTSWLGGRSVQRFDGVTGELQQRWRVQHRTGNIYGFTVDIDGDVWGAYWSDPYVAWIDGDHQCPNNGVDCNISPGNGIIRDIDVRDAVQAAGGSANLGGRGVAVDANRFVWAVFNDLSGGGWEQAPSYAVKIDGTSGEPIRAVPTGRGSVGITPDANGFIWVVNYGGGGANFQSSYTCPNGYNPSAGGTVTKLRSSDGSVVATYPTCGDRPYTYSDMAGYNLRSVTLRSGTWR
ncbi:MAG: hypothetical protein CMH57_12780, partial [Myxococcales bacterium]|nr:hypothetical protein [Myxococcales bacterium]